MTHLIQHIGNTILVVMMDVEEGHEAEFDRWYNEEHLPERMAIPGYVSARRFKVAGRADGWADSPVLARSQENEDGQVYDQ